MNIAYHSSDLFVPVLAVSMISLMQNNQSFETIEFYVIGNKISKGNKALLKNMVESNGRKITFIPMPDVNKEEKLGLKMIKDRWMFDSYVRMFLEKHLPETVERVLYLDSDTLVVDNLSELWNMDLAGLPAALAFDCVSEEYYKLFKMSDTSFYCNSGVALIDLKEWKKRSVSDRVRNCVRENNGYVFFMEQSVQNIVLQDEIVLLPARYNVSTLIMNMTYDEMMRLRKPKRYYLREEIDAARKYPAIIHMTNSFLIINRAWFENTNHPAKELYRKYYMMTPWKDEPLFPDNRDWSKKIFQIVVDHIPRSILFPVVSFIYNYMRIWSIKRSMKKYARIQKEHRE